MENCKSISFSEEFEMVSRAGKFVREKYKIHPHQVVTEEFEKEFNCQILYNENFMDTMIEFNNEKDLTMFLLRWG